MRSLPTANPFLKQLMRTSDILFISEHRLYSNELYKLESINHQFIVHSKASKDLDSRKQSYKAGHCGTGMFWHSAIGNKVRIMSINSDRICGIEIVDFEDTQVR